MPADAGALAAADVGFSLAVVRYVTHLASGRLNPAEISRIITLEPERPAAAEILLRLSDATAAAPAVSQYEPPHPQYKALKAKLAELRTSTAEATQVVVPEGSLLRPGKADARVPILRTRLSVAAEAAAEPDIYDAVLVEAVKTFQSESGLTADGVLGPRTLGALNGPNRADDIAAVVTNMERWRWLPRDLGDFHVFVNVPEFMVRVSDAGSIVHETRVIVGKPEHATPTFSHVMDHLVVNPFWHVPASIVTNEMLPEIRQNPYGYFAKRGYQVLAKAGGKMRVVDPDSIDWWMVNPRSVQIRQVPGDANALGRIKFMFPNQHSVYLHDTPTKKLFQRDHRAFSHGCVRVDNPLDFADAILKVAAPEWNSGRLEALYGGKEQRINLDTPIPVHLSYFTRSVDAEGEMRRFEDIYGYDREMRQLLGQ
jgi:murein L,D-transpeptidase YcbB/YkuD